MTAQDKLKIIKVKHNLEKIITRIKEGQASKLNICFYIENDDIKYLSEICEKAKEIIEKQENEINDLKEQVKELKWNNNNK